MRPIRVHDPNHVAREYLEIRRSGGRCWPAWQLMHPERMYRIFFRLQTMGLPEATNREVSEAMLLLRERL